MPVPNWDLMPDYDGPDKCPHCHEIIDERDTPVVFEDGNHGHSGCKADYDDEHRDEPPLSLYAFKHYCLVCQQPITDEDKSAAVVGGFIHRGADYNCYNDYEIAKDLIDATTPELVCVNCNQLKSEDPVCPDPRAPLAAHVYAELSE